MLLQHTQVCDIIPTQIDRAVALGELLLNLPLNLAESLDQFCWSILFEKQGSFVDHDGHSHGHGRCYDDEDDDDDNAADDDDDDDDHFGDNHYEDEEEDHLGKA